MQNPADIPTESPTASAGNVAAALRLWRDVDDVGPNFVLQIDRLLRGLIGMIGGGAAAWALVGADGNSGVLSMVYVGWDDPVLQELANRHLPNLLAAVGRPSAVSNGAQLDGEARHDSELARSVAEPLGIEDMIHSSLILSVDVRSVLQAYRLRDDRTEYSEQDCQVVDLVHAQSLGLLRCDVQRDPTTTTAMTPDALAGTAEKLSPRQSQTLQMLLSGDSEKQIAAKLQRSRHTIHMHVKAVYRALAVSSRAELLSRFVNADRAASLRADSHDSEIGH